MNYGHVGRPTNEEVAQRKRKQTMKVLIPVVALVAVVGVVASGSLKGTMGNSVTDCEKTCEEGWKLEGESCVQNIDTPTETTSEKAYLVGDAINEDGEEIPDGKVTSQDWLYIQKEINSDNELTEEQELIYDLNGDGEVNGDDVKSYATSTTGEMLYNETYVCPKETVETVEEDEITIEYTHNYELVEPSDDTGEYYCKHTYKEKHIKEATNSCELTDDDDIEIDDDIIEIDDEEEPTKSSLKSASKSSHKVTGTGQLVVRKWNKKLCKKPRTGNKRVNQTKEPCANKAVLYWSSKKKLKKNNFVYPKDKKTNLPLGAWPKNYKSYPTQLKGYKTYHNYYMWPVTPLNGIYYSKYQHVGMDVETPFGTPVYSPVSGKLVYSKWGGTINKGSDETSYSVTIKPSKILKYKGVKINEVFLTHLSGIRYRCNSIKKCKRKVKAGELIGFSGTAAGTPNTKTTKWAPHLHLTLYNSSNYDAGLQTSSTEKFYKIKNKTKRKVGE